MKRNLLTIMLAFFVAFGVNAQDFGKAPVNKKANQTQINNFVKDIDASKADQDAYVGNTTAGVYSSIVLADGTTTATGTIASDPFPMAEEFADDGNVYRVDANLGFGTVNPDDGTFTSLGTLTGYAGTPTGLAWDWASSTMYVLVLDGGNLPHLCTLDIGTLVLTEIGAGTGMLIAMDFANDGYLYAPALDDENLYQIDPATGATTVIGSTGLGLNFGQDVSFDPVSGMLYTVAGGDQNWFGTYDLATGAFTQISDIGEQCGVFVVCKYPAEDGAPASVENFAVTADAAGALTVDFSWDNPTLQHDGNALTELTEVVLYIDNISVYTDNTAGIGGSVSETGFVVTGGMHSFKVVAFNSVGGSVPVSMGTFIGVDVEVSETNLPGVAGIDEVVTPFVTVMNNGVGAQTFDVTLSDGDAYSEVVSVTSLASGASEVLTFPDWSSATAAVYTFTATAADPGSDFDLANNELTQTLAVLGGCLHTLTLTDSYGDGWNGATASVMVNGFTVLDHVTVDATENTYTFLADDGDDIQFDFWAEGSWNSECSWVMLDGLGNELFSGSEVLTTENVVGLCTMGYSVTFNVTMTDSIASGYFVEGTDQLWVAGSMNAWTTPGDDAAYELIESATDDIYTVTVSLADADYEYKYFKIVGGVAEWTYGEWEGGTNRAFSVAGADVTLNDLFGNPTNSIAELISKGISVYPNPSNGVFTVNVENNFNLEVFDITGKVISANTISGSTTLELDNAGVYFLRFSNEKGSVTQRVIVQ